MHDTPFTCQLSQLYCAPPQGFRLCHALYTAMTMDFSFWKKLLYNQSAHKNIAAELLRTTFVVQDLSGAGTLPSDPELTAALLDRVRLYCGKSQCFHAKLAILDYVSDQQEHFFRLGVFSKNLTCDSDDQNGIILDCSCGQAETDDGKRLYDYLCLCAKDSAPYASTNWNWGFEAIKNIQLPFDAHIWFNGCFNGKSTSLWDVLLNDGSTPRSLQPTGIAVTKSEFVGRAFRENAANQNSSLEIWNKYTGEKDPTHMKLYLLKYADGRCRYWSGSANCSENGLGINPKAPAAANIECLVEVPIDAENYDQILEALKLHGYLRQTQFAKFTPAETERSAENRLLNQILEEHRFFWSNQSGSWQIEAEPQPLCQSVQGYSWEVKPLVSGQRGYGVLSVCGTTSRYRIFLPQNAKLSSAESYLRSLAQASLEKFQNAGYVDCLLELYGTNRLAELAALETKIIAAYQNLEQQYPVPSTLSALYPVIELIQMLDKKLQITRPNPLPLPPTAPAAAAPQKDPEIFNTLKPFQRATARYILDKFTSHNIYTLADEAGMGKTFVALGIIGAMYEKKANRPLNVYYMCSNQRILEQNSSKLLNYLNKTYPDKAVKSDCDRLSLAFKPSPVADGIILYPMSSSLMRDTHSKTGNDLERNTLRAALNIKTKPECWTETEMQQARARGQQMAMQKNPPDLILLDEFHQMNPEDIKALKELTQKCAAEPKLLLISATPFALTSSQVNSTSLYGLSDEDANPVTALSLADFLEYTDSGSREILTAQKEHSTAVEALIQNPSDETWEKARRCSCHLQKLLQQVICRTERGRLSKQAQPEELENPHRPAIRGLNLDYAADTAAGHYQALVPGAKSYQLRFKNSKNPENSAYTFEQDNNYTYLWKNTAGLQLGSWNQNPRLAAIDAAAVQGFEQLLWVPPIKPYYPLGGVFKNAADKGFSKLLVFSGWVMIPRAVSSIFSYEADRRNGGNASALTDLDCKLDYAEVQRLAEQFPVSALRSLYAHDPRNTKALGAPQVCLYRILHPYVQNALYQIHEHLMAYKKKKWSAAAVAEIFYLPDNKADRTLRMQISRVKNAGGREGFLWMQLTALLGGNYADAYDCTEQLRTEFRNSDQSLPREVFAAITAAHLFSLLGDAFNRYFNLPSVRLALEKAGVKDQDSLFGYCTNGNLQAVLDEWFFVQNSDVGRFLSDLKAVLEQEPSTVHLLCDDGIGSENTAVQECCYAQRYTDDKSDSNEHNTSWQNTIQAAFNSPFWPMILSTTSIAQEGLDFHCYCRKIMHYTLPATPAAIEQREGRIDRYRGYIQRLRQAKHNPDLNWAQMFAQDAPGSSGIVPGWVVPPEEDDLRMERITAILPQTAEDLRYEKLLRCKREYRSILGMPNSMDEVQQLADIAQELDRPLQEIFPDLSPR